MGGTLNKHDREKKTILHFKSVLKRKKKKKELTLGEEGNDISIIKKRETNLDPCNCL